MSFFSTTPFPKNLPGSKQELRATLLRQRAALSPETWAEHSAVVQRRVLELPLWQAARSVALYCDARNEIATGHLLERAWAEGKQVFLPRCLPPSEGEGLMVFVRVSGPSELVRGAFGLLEPTPDAPALPRTSPAGSPPPIDAFPELVLVPSVGVSPCGGRIGYGKGYYDRLLSLPDWNSLPRLALVHHFQLVNFPADPLDVPLHGYVTEKELVWL